MGVFDNYIAVNLWWLPDWYRANFEIYTFLIALAIFVVIFFVLRHRIAFIPYVIMVVCFGWMIYGIGWWFRHNIIYTWVTFFASAWCPLALLFCTFTFALIAFQFNYTYWGLRATNFMVGFCLGFALWIGVYVFMNFYPIWATFDWFHMGLLIFPMILFYYGLVKHRKGRWIILGLVVAIAYMFIMYWGVAVPNGWYITSGYYTTKGLPWDQFWMWK